MKGKGSRWLGAAFGCARRSRLPPTQACARDTLIPAFSHKGLTRVGLRLNSRLQSRAGARRTLILAFSHKGRRDPLAGRGAWLRAAISLAADAGLRPRHPRPSLLQREKIAAGCARRLFSVAMLLLANQWRRIRRSRFARGLRANLTPHYSLFSLVPAVTHTPRSAPALGRLSCTLRRGSRRGVRSWRLGGCRAGWRMCRARWRATMRLSAPRLGRRL